MTTSRRNRKAKRGWTMRLGGTAVLALCLALSGCGMAPDYVTEDASQVLFYVTSVNGGSVLDSEVRYGTLSDDGLLFICEDEVPVAVGARLKNPRDATEPSVPNAVQIKGYEVRYRRSDGRNEEGVDVPYRISGAISSGLDVGENTVVTIEVVRRQAKREPPLSNIEQSRVLTVFAEVTLFGETISGDRVRASGSLQIDFADFADDETSCPS
jgi:hypothetical protein